MKKGVEQGFFEGPGVIPRPKWEQDLIFRPEPWLRRDWLDEELDRRQAIERGSAVFEDEWGPPLRKEEGPESVCGAVQGQRVVPSSGKSSSADYKRSRRWVSNGVFHLSRFPLGRLVFVTVTMGLPQLGPEHLECPRGRDWGEWAAEVREKQREQWLRFGAVMRDVLNGPSGGRWYRVGDLVESYVRVAEWRLDPNGVLKKNSMHFHFIFVMREDVGEGFRHDLYPAYRTARQKKDYRLANALSKQLGWHPVLVEMERRFKGARAALARSANPFKLGIFEVRPCYGEDCGGVVKYLSNYLSKGEQRPEAARGIRIVNYSRNWEQNHGAVFTMMAGRAAAYRAQGRALSAMIRIPYEKMRVLFGARWRFWLGEVLRLVNVSHISGLPEWGLCNLTPSEKESVERERWRQGCLMLFKPVLPGGLARPWRYKDHEAFNLNQALRWFETNWDRPLGWTGEIPDLLDPSAPF